MNKVLFDKYGKLKVQGFDSKLFIFGLALKLILAFYFASGFIADLFAPFVNHFVSSGFGDPYEFFNQQGSAEAFPYPALMLYIMAVPRILFGFVFSAGFSEHLQIFAYKLPILLADFTILTILLRWLKTNAQQVLKLYWLSPILIYINYIHGQLDAIPIALLFISMYFLFKEKYLYSSLVLALALATKTHIVILLPFFVLYFYKSRKLKITDIALNLTSIVLCFVALNYHYLLDADFQAMVFNNAQQAKVYKLNIAFPLIDLDREILFYLVPAAYMVLLAKSANIKSYNKDLFIMFLGFSFGILMVLTTPSQGWYYWILPFLIYFYIKQEEDKINLSFVALNIFYFAYFYLLSTNLVDSKILNLCFTALQTSLALNCIWIYQKGIRSNIQLKIKSEPFLLGVGGDSGAGKSTYSDLIQKVLGSSNTTIIRGDDMHKYERGDAMWDVYTHLNPKANLLHEEAEQVLKLKQGEKIDRRHYDHSVGKFTLPQEVQANKLVVIEGLHPFFLEKMRKAYDLKVFILPDEELRVDWKIERDVVQRGHSKAKVLDQIEQRKEDSAKYIDTQVQHADIVLSFVKHESSGISLRLQFDNNVNIDALIAHLEKIETLEIDHFYDAKRQHLHLHGDISQDSIDYIAYDAVPELEDIIMNEPEWESNYNGLIQLFTAFYIFETMKG